MSEESEKEVEECDYITSEHIHIAAYFNWQNRGCPHGDPLFDWDSAHKQIVQAGR